MEGQQNYKIKRSGQLGSADAAGDGYICSYGAKKDAPTYYYVGYTKPGTTKWRFMRINKTTLDFDWAYGEEGGDDAWAIFDTLTYSTELI